MYRFISNRGQNIAPRCLAEKKEQRKEHDNCQNSQQIALNMYEHVNYFALKLSNGQVIS